MTQRQRQISAAQQAQQTRNQVHPDFASVESVDGVTFTSGNMMVNGTPQSPTEAQRWESSNGLTTYTTVKWRDSATGKERVSCNCTGWAMKRGDKPRRCKHTDDMMGIKPCTAKKVDGSTVTITSISQAESIIPQFEGRALRGIMLD